MPVNIMDFGARPDGTTDNTAAFRLALGVSVPRHVHVPPGRYLLNGGCVIPEGGAVSLDLGAVLVAGQSIDVGNGAQLLGLAAYAPYSAPPYPANVVSAGDPAVVPLRVGVASDAHGCRLRGLLVDGGGKADLGVQVGSWTNNNSVAWTVCEDVAVVQCVNGVDVQASQDSRYQGLWVYNPDWGQTVDPSPGCGIRLGAGPKVVNNLRFENTLVTNFTDHVRVESGWNVTFQGGYFVGLPGNDGCAFRLVSGGKLSLLDLRMDGSTETYGPGTTRLVQVGSLTRHPEVVVIERCQFAAITAAIEVIGWQYLQVRDCRFDLGVGQVGLLNTGGGPICRYLHWGPNDVQGSGPEMVGGLKGFDSAYCVGMDPALFGNRSQPTRLPGRTSDPTMVNPGDSIRLVPSGLCCKLGIRDRLNGYGEVYVPGDGSPAVVMFDPQQLYGGQRWAVLYDSASGTYQLHNAGAQPLTVNLTTTAL